MRRRLRNRRGLAEIVGTLMLVVIVVAAAVAFSLFVASYQAQLENERRAAHDRALEKIHFLGIGVHSAGLVVNMTFVSADVNHMNITGFVVNGYAVQSWKFYPRGVIPPSWMNTSGCPNDTGPIEKESCDMLAPFQEVTVSLVPLSAVASPIRIGIFTGLANEFQFTFVNPVAIASVFFVSTGTGQTTPVFDGTASYQPSEPDNASIVEYNWTVTPVGGGGTTLGNGEEFEDASVTPGSNYTVQLTVTNTDGLLDQAHFQFTEP